MAYLREYRYYEESNLLIEYFYLDSSHQLPSLVLRLSVGTLELHVYRRRSTASRFLICKEIEHLYLLVEEPYWKHFVRRVNPDYRYRNYELQFPESDS